jgi:gamma-glutamylcyclotransferase (GGCT)/AIG2-like uncharacterized protein YtfP
MFIYGSNNKDQLSKRINNNNLTYIPAYLPDHIRIFAGYSKKWDGGVATIYPVKNKNIYGAVVKINIQEIKKLDKYEKGYIKENVKVILNDKREIDAFTYKKINYLYDKPPSDEYINAIRKMLNENKFNKNKILVRGIIKDNHNNEKIILI